MNVHRCFALTGPPGCCKYTFRTQHLIIHHLQKAWGGFRKLKKYVYTHILLTYRSMSPSGAACLLSVFLLLTRSERVLSGSRVGFLAQARETRLKCLDILDLCF